MTHIEKRPDVIEVAQELDSQIRKLAQHAHVVLDALRVLVEEAKATNIHETLGFPSWTAYLADALDGQWNSLLARDKRAEAIRFLGEQGMSTRAIARMTGSSKSSVARELEATCPNLGQVIGLDGKTYPRPEPQVDQPGTPDEESDEEWLARKLAEPRTVRIPANVKELKQRMAEIHSDEQRAYEMMYKLALEKVNGMSPGAHRDAIEFGLHMREMRRRALRGFEQGMRIEQIAESMGTSVEMVEDYVAAPTSSDIQFFRQVLARDEDAQ